MATRWNRFFCPKQPRILAPMVPVRKKTSSSHTRARQPGVAPKFREVGEHRPGRRSRVTPRENQVHWVRGTTGFNRFPFDLAGISIPGGPEPESPGARPSTVGYEVGALFVPAPAANFGANGAGEKKKNSSSRTKARQPGVTPKFREVGKHRTGRSSRATPRENQVKWVRGTTGFDRFPFGLAGISTLGGPGEKNGVTPAREQKVRTCKDRFPGIRLPSNLLTTGRGSRTDPPCQTRGTAGSSPREGTALSVLAADRGSCSGRTFVTVLFAV